jgi:hypothetical protein
LQESLHRPDRPFFSIRFKEHKQAARYNSTTSNFAKYINEQAHSFETIETTMSILKKTNKRPTPEHTREVLHLQKDSPSQ